MVAQFKWAGASAVAMLQRQKLPSQKLHKKSLAIGREVEAEAQMEAKSYNERKEIVLGG